MRLSFSNIKIGKRIALGFALVLVIFAALVWEVDRSMSSSLEKQTEYSRRNHQLVELLTIKADFIEVRREITLYAMRGGSTDAIEKGIGRVEGTFKDMRNLFRQEARKQMSDKALGYVEGYRGLVEDLKLVREDHEKVLQPLEKARALGQQMQDTVMTLVGLVSTDLKKLEVQTRLEAERTASIIRIGGALSIILGLFFAFVISRSITRPIGRITSVMGGLADGDLKLDVPYTGNGDEVGQMARAVEVFKENAIKVEAMRKEQEAAEQRAAAERRKALHKMADDFEARVMGVVKGVSSSATEMQATARSMTQIAQETSAQSTTVAAAAPRRQARMCKPSLRRLKSCPPRRPRSARASAKRRASPIRPRRRASAQARSCVNLPPAPPRSVKSSI